MGAQPKRKVEAGAIQAEFPAMQRRNMVRSRYRRISPVCFETCAIAADDMAEPVAAVASWVSADEPSSVWCDEDDYYVEVTRLTLAGATWDRLPSTSKRRLRRPLIERDPRAGALMFGEPDAWWRAEDAHRLEDLTRDRGLKCLRR